MTFQIIFSGYQTLLAKTWGKEVGIPLMSALVGLGFLPPVPPYHPQNPGQFPPHPPLSQMARLELNILIQPSLQPHTLFLPSLSCVVKRQRIQSPTSSSVWFKLSGTGHLHKLFKARAAFLLISFQNTFLQETVRRECEERFELTEALSQAREQLLELRRSGGSLPCSLSKGTLTYPATAASNHREQSSARQNCGRGAHPPSRHGLPKPTASPSPDKLKKVSSSGLPALPQSHPPRGRASSVNETRRRLTAILSRRLSQQWWPDQEQFRPPCTHPFTACQGSLEQGARKHNVSVDVFNKDCKMLGTVKPHFSKGLGIGNRNEVGIPEGWFPRSCMYCTLCDPGLLGFSA